ncbi:unnamed protein product, partial [marine sediment metagenome]
WEDSNYSEAFISASSALELAISSYIKKNADNHAIYEIIKNVFLGKSAYFCRI